MHCFDDVRAILFIVNLAGYDQVLFEDTAKNRMLEELELFEQVSTWGHCRESLGHRGHWHWGDTVTESRGESAKCACRTGAVAEPATRPVTRAPVGASPTGRRGQGQAQQCVKSAAF